MKILPFRWSLQVLAVIATLLAVSACGPVNKTTAVQVRITAQPHGGLYVNTVSCTYTGTATDPTGKSGAEIIVAADFHSSDGEVLANAGSMTLYGIDSQTATATKSAPSGYYLDKDFWCEIHWNDCNGEHLLVSDTAHCRVN